METRFDLIVVSVFGRGHWLASEAQARGLKVAVVDLSGRMGRWTPEDREGPFGLFQSEGIFSSQLARLEAEDYQESIDDGFVVWLKSGPIDLKSSLTSYLLEAKGLSPEVEEYLSKFESMSSSEKSRLKQVFQELGFNKTWLAQLANQLASTKVLSNFDAVASGQPLPLFSPYSVRRVSRRGFEASLQWLRDQEVAVHSDSALTDVSLDGKSIDGVEIESEWSGFLQGKFVVWGLTGQETEFASRSISSILCPAGVVKPMWSWLRYRFRMDKQAVTDVLPRKFVIIEDLELPWTHANFCLVQKSVSDQDVDVWIKVPSSQRFQRSYLDEQERGIQKVLKSRLPSGQVECLDKPQDYLYEYVDLGPSPFAVFDSEQLKSNQRLTLRNLYYDSPENWVNQDWTGQFSSQANLLDEIVAKFEKQLKPEEGGRVDRALHP